MEILIAIIVLSVIGLVLGIAIGICNKFLYVKTDDRVEKIYELLPKANCGGCGYPGCMGLASEIVKGVSPTSCKPCKAENVEAIKKILASYKENNE